MQGNPYRFQLTHWIKGEGEFADNGSMPWDGEWHRIPWSWTSNPIRRLRHRYSRVLTDSGSRGLSGPLIEFRTAPREGQYDGNRLFYAWARFVPESEADRHRPQPPTDETVPDE